MINRSALERYLPSKTRGRCPIVFMATSTDLDNVKVEVISNERSLPRYDDPDAIEQDQPRTRQNYIEAVTGAKFIVRVTLDERFYMGHCDAARIVLSFDGAERGWYCDVNRGNDHRLKDRPLRDRQVKFSHAHQFCERTKQWKSGRLCFGNLVMSTHILRRLETRPDSALSAAETSGSTVSPAEIQKLG